MNAATHGQRILLSPREVEAIYGIPVPTLAYWRKHGTDGPKFLRIGPRRIKYRVKDVDSWVDQQNPDA